KGSEKWDGWKLKIYNPIRAAAQLSLLLVIKLWDGPSSWDYWTASDLCGHYGPPALYIGLFGQGSPLCRVSFKQCVLKPAPGETTLSMR
ncbi:hypothetical protein Bpfe_018415, partial [Biomphalaria pfeifferi]